MVLDSFRRIEIDIDSVNQYIPPIQLSANDRGGRMLLVKLTDDGKKVDATGLTARLLFTSQGGTGGYKTMDAVSGYETAAWECAVPGAALSTARARLAIAIFAGEDSVVVCRSFQADVDGAIVAMDEATTDALDEFYAAVRKIDSVGTTASKDFNAQLEAQQQSFETAETARATAFKEAEKERSSEESKRKEAEKERDSSEKERESSEKQREEDFGQAKKKADDAASRCDAATAAAKAALPLGLYVDDDGCICHDPQED